MLDRIDDTIVAIASPPGTSRLGIVRLSGQQSIDVASHMATREFADLIRQARSSTRVACRLDVDDTGEVPAACLIFRAPRSYTRQDCVEIHTIGSPAVLEYVRQRAMECGAIPALPGEFTARAFVNGAMDLSAAEAVAGVIRARSDTQLAAARRMMDGSLARRISALRDELAELLALVEADIDFAEEPIEFITPGDARHRLLSVQTNLDELLRGSAVAERAGVLPRILLLGRPNAGKSTLMNALCGHDRAITAAVSGTTRDILSAPIRIGRGEALLLDAAGIDESDDEVIAQARSIVLSEVDRVDLVCVVVDLTNPEWDRVHAMIEPLEAPRLVIAANKADKLNVECRMSNVECTEDGIASEEVSVNTARRKDHKASSSTERGPSEKDIERSVDLHSEFDIRHTVGRAGSARLKDLDDLNAPAMHISAKTSEGLDDLRAAFASALANQSTTTLAESMLITERQGAAIREATASLIRADELCRHATETIDCADLLAFELREALDTLGGVTGAVTTEELLGQVFALFCIGK